MSNYTKTTNFTAKDALNPGDSEKIISGVDFDTEFNNLATAVNSKADAASGTLTGTTTAASMTFSGTLTANGTVDFSSATVSNGGSVTTIDINGGTVDGTVIGGASAAAGTFTTLTATTYVGLPTSSTTTAGIVELATIAETNTGTDTTRAVTPDGLDGWTGSAQITTVGAISSGSIEGTAVKSTGEAGGVKFLREDGDGTCSWQGVPGGIDTLSGLNDTNFTGPTSSDVIQYSGSEWVDRSLSEAGIAPVASPTFTGTAIIPTATITNGTITTADINGGTIDGTTQASGTINGPIAAGGTWTAAAAWTLPSFTAGGTSNFTGTFQIGGVSVTSTAAELNILDGVTATAAEINKLDGVTATTAELNYNDLPSGLGTVAANKVVTAGASAINFSSFDMTNVDINSGTIDGVTIGAASAPTATLGKTTFTAEVVEYDDTHSQSAGTLVLDPANGNLQRITLTQNVTTVTDNLAAGEYISLHILDGTAYTISWPAGWDWIGGSAPTLDTTNMNIIEVWKAGTQTYAAYVGAAS